MNTLENKNILVVGASSGIGYAITQQLTGTKANIFSASRNTPDLPADSGIKHISLDVLKLESALEELPDQLHALVYCPGTINLKPFQSLKEKDFQRDFGLNVLGAVNVIQACLSKLKKAEGASIVLFSTVAVKVGMTYHASIAAAKGAVEGLGRSLAAELASKRVRVNIIAPSLTETPLAQGLLSTDEKRKAANDRHPLGRIGNPEDIASMVSYLVSDESSWMTGQVLGIDGGISTLKPL